MHLNSTINAIRIGLNGLIEFSSTLREKRIYPIFRFSLFLFIIGVQPLYAQGQEENPILKFMMEHSGRTAIYLVRNDSIRANHRSDEMMPLASTMKIIIAIEYAEQAGKGKIDAQERVPIADVNLFYVPNTDGGMHNMWTKAMKASGKIVDDSVSMEEIAKGMMTFSSNANSEYLIWRLGLDNINANLKNLGMKDHEPIFPFVSSLFVSETGKNGDPLDDNAYIQEALAVHEKLKLDRNGKFKQKMPRVTMAEQRNWSDRLPSSTAKTYAVLMEKINDREYFTKEEYRHLSILMEFLMKNPQNRTWLNHAGMKGGSTASVLTKAMYATDKDGNSTELVYFFDDLNYQENLQLQKSANAFELKVLTDATFLDNLEKKLKKKSP